MNEKKKSKKNYRNSGTLQIASIQVVERRIPPEVAQALKKIQPTDQLELTVRGRNLAKMDTFGNSGLIVGKTQPRSFLNILSCRAKWHLPRDLQK